jgi:predicted dehydrogenase
VYGTAGAASTSPFQILVDDGTGVKDETPADLPAGREGAQGNFLRFQRFLDAMTGKEEVLVKPEESLNVQRIMDGLYKSAETRKAVQITE